MTRYTVVITDSSTDYGHDHEATSRKQAISIARSHRGGLYKCSGGTIKVFDRETGMVIWGWHEGAEGGYFTATPTYQHAAMPEEYA